MSTRAPSSPPVPTFPSRPRSRPATGTAPTVPGLDERDPHVIFFTSGSTGRPKGVVLCAAPLAAHLRGRNDDCGRRGHCVHVPAVPHGGVDHRARRVAGPATGALRAHARHRRRCGERRQRAPAAARLYCIPAVWSRILAHGVGKFDLSTLEEADTGTSATPPEPCATIGTRPAYPTRVFYGSTEAGPGVQLGDADLFRKPGSVGVAQPGVEVRIGAAVKS